MFPAQIRPLLSGPNFKPIRITMSDGRAFEIPHPDFVSIGKSTLVVQIDPDPESGLPERTVHLDLLHITSVEPISGPVPTSPAS